MVINSFKMEVVWWVWCIYTIVKYLCYLLYFSLISIIINKGVNQLKDLDLYIDAKSEGWRSQSQVDISQFSLGWSWSRCGHGELQPPGHLVTVDMSRVQNGEWDQSSCGDPWLAAGRWPGLYPAHRACRYPPYALTLLSITHSGKVKLES